jgi:amino acid adenylation domain-containing protein
MPFQLPVHEEFEKLAVDQPEATALVQGTVRLSYGELNARANQLARHLRSLGARPETVVGICLDRTPEYVVAELACLKAGAAFMPMDPGYPAARLTGMAQDSGAALIIQRGGDPLGPRAIDLSESGPAISACGTADLDGTVMSAALVYLIYTSGSTGAPKGVQVEQRQLGPMLAEIRAALRLGRHSRCLQASPFAFDMSIALTFSVLTAGGTVILAGATDTARPDRLIDLLAGEDIDTVVLPPSVLAMLPEASMPGVRTLCTGGEACAVSIMRRFSPGRHFINAYGPTETTIAATIYVITESAGPAEDLDEVPIGSALAGARVYVLDEDGQPVREGETGDIYIGGIGVSRGYRRQPAATAERFVPDPFASVPGSRMYRTGDLGQVRPDGALQFRGRTDHQVKINGYRIELGEIERTLEAHPAVRQAVVVVGRSPLGRPELRGFVSPAGPVDGKDLRHFLAERVPEQLVPSVILPVTLPLTANGKIDRAGLALMELPRTPAPREFVPPQTKSEEIIAEVWARTLDVPRVGRLDDFFQFGGDSVTAGKLVARLRETLGVELPIRVLFEPGMTIQALGAAIDSGEYPPVKEAGHRIPRRRRAR